MKQCPNCEHSAKDDDAFCLMCGTPLSSVFAVNELEAPVSAEQKDQADAITEVPETLEPTIQANGLPLKPEQFDTAVIAPEPVETTVRQPAKNNFTFLNTGVGIIVAVLLPAVAVFLIIQNRYPFVFNAAQFALLTLISIAIALTTRAKGPDFSIGAVIATAPVFMAFIFLYTESLLISILLTICAYAVFGLLNGILATYLKIPVIVLTLLTGLIVKGVSYFVIFGDYIGANITPPQFSLEAPVLPIIAAVVFIAAFLFVLFSRLGTPIFKRDDKSKLSYMFAYVSSAVIASGTGILLLWGNLGGAAYTMLESETYVIFAFAVLISSRAFDNKFAPVPLCLLPAVVWVLMQNALIPALFGLHGIAVGQYVTGGGLAFIMLIIAYACRCKRKDSKYAASNDISLMR